MTEMARSPLDDIARDAAGARAAAETAAVQGDQSYYRDEALASAMGVVHDRVEAGRAENAAGFTGLGAKVDSLHSDVTAGQAATTAGIGDLRSRIDTMATSTATGLSSIDGKVDTLAADTAAGFTGLGNQATANHAATTHNLAAIHNGLSSISAALAPPKGPRPVTPNLLARAGMLDGGYRPLAVSKITHVAENDTDMIDASTGKVYGELTGSRAPLVNEDYVDPDNPFGYYSDAPDERFNPRTGRWEQIEGRVASKRSKALLDPINVRDNFGSFRRGREHWQEAGRRRTFIRRAAGRVAAAAHIAYGATKVPSEFGLDLVNRGLALQGNRERNFVIRHSLGILMRLGGTAVAIPMGLLHPPNLMPGRILDGGRPSLPPNPRSVSAHTRRGHGGAVQTNYFPPDYR